VEIVSRPYARIQQSEARFLVGSQRPFGTGQPQLAHRYATRDQVIQYRDVGTKLTVRPTSIRTGMCRS